MAGGLEAMTIEPVELSGPFGVVEQLARPQVLPPSKRQPRGRPGAGTVVGPPRRRRRRGGYERYTEDEDAPAGCQEQRALSADHGASSSQPSRSRRRAW